MSIFPTNNYGNRDDRTWAFVAALLGIILLVLSAVVALAIAAPESANPASVIATLLGLLGLSVPALVGAIVAGRSSQKLDRVLNGEMDRKIVRGVHNAMDERGDGSTS